MHPVIRFFCILCLAWLLARPSVSILLVCSLLVLIAAMRVRLPPGHLFQVSWRLRYLLLIILLLYGWATPGDPLIQSVSRWSPTVQGLMDGAVHIASLVVLVAAVQVLLTATERGELVAALRWWFRPLGLIGISADRSALRLVLVMEAVPRISALVRRQLEQRGAGLRSWRALPAMAGELFAMVLEDADRMRPGPVRIPMLPPPAMREWLGPVLLVVLLMLIR